MSSKTSHSFKEVFGVLNAIQQELFILRNNKSPETKTIACQTEESGPVASSSSSWTEVSSADIRSSTPSSKVSARGQPPILIIHSASADKSADKSAAKYSEMSASLGVLSNIWPQ